jgi:hypothetical protein
MAERKPWDSLSASYRERLSRKGITPESHARGESIRAARGHENTPEHPREVLTKPEKFRDYVSDRQNLIQQVARRKRRLFGLDHKFNPRRSNKVISAGWDGGHAPSNSQLRWAIGADEDELMEAMTSGDEDYSFLWYH